MVKPTLLVLAAGMGSRYGALKQMDGVGPNNEAIIDYSIYDAIRAGFGKVVFVIRHSFADAFTAVFNAERFGHRIEVEYVYQELDYLPEGFTLPEGRTRLYRDKVDASMAQAVAQTLTVPDKAINLVYLTDVGDTRFDAFGVLRPLNLGMQQLPVPTEPPATTAPPEPAPVPEEEPAQEPVEGV